MRVNVLEVDSLSTNNEALINTRFRHLAAYEYLHFREFVSPELSLHGGRNGTGLGVGREP